MDSNDTPKPIPVAATAPALAPDDPRLSTEAIEYRRSNNLVEHDEHGRLAFAL